MSRGYEHLGSIDYIPGDDPTDIQELSVGAGVTNTRSWVELADDKGTIVIELTDKSRALFAEAFGLELPARDRGMVDRYVDEGTF